MHFERCIGIDYSGAGLPDQPLPGIQVFTTAGDNYACITPPWPTLDTDWSRKGVANWLIDCADEEGPFIAGIDHAFGFPMAYLEKYDLADKPWQSFLDDFAANWPTQETNVTVANVLKSGPDRTGDPSWLRLTERWTTSAKSVFNFKVPGAVAWSTHAGLTWLREIRKRTGRFHFWPFDGWEIPEGKSAIVEVYPALFNKRYLDECADLDQHQADAYCVTRWLDRMNECGALELYLHPPLLDEEGAMAEREGWILGVM